MSTRSRVPEHTNIAAGRQIIIDIEQRLEYFLDHPQKITQRLQELDKEWDIERTLEVNSSALSLFGLAMGFAVNRRWFLLPLAVQGFFMQHAIQGWCPPLPILRRMGFRTADEINYERYALKTIRGDLEHFGESSEIAGSKLPAAELLQAVID